MDTDSGIQRRHRIAAIPGDGIGLEVTEVTVEVLQKAAEVLGTFTLEFTHFDWNSKNFLGRGYYIPEGGLDLLRTHDAVLFGAVGSPGTFFLPKKKILCLRNPSFRLCMKLPP